jgi:hypothetical protein
VDVGCFSLVQSFLLKLFIVIVITSSRLFADVGAIQLLGKPYYTVGFKNLLGPCITSTIPCRIRHKEQPLRILTWTQYQVAYATDDPTTQSPLPYDYSPSIEAPPSSKPRSYPPSQHGTLPGAVVGTNQSGPGAGDRYWHWHSAEGTEQTMAGAGIQRCRCCAGTRNWAFRLRLRLRLRDPAMEVPMRGRWCRGMLG